MSVLYLVLSMVNKVPTNHYHYTNMEDMQKAVANGDFIETATFSGNMYGTSKKAVEDVIKQYKVCILDIDMQGVISVRGTSLDPIYVFVKPPSMTVLEERLRGRKTESEEAIKKRLQTAEKEMKFIEKEIANGSHIIVNDDIAKAYENLKNIEEIGEQFVKARSHRQTDSNSDGNAHFESSSNFPVVKCEENRHP
ncbi:reconstructed ancestral guanylate kinase [Apostichopus japonicus]|uniref:Reconstructed ancestral guanylate kinase n=1 Tax=Stichopus japonicus TaxID=307972 RepID=A0A2G8LKZ3_STIJA|nr:reconstructed ancestral guanylate kinase [Apostichopus japonicus]